MALLLCAGLPAACGSSSDEDEAVTFGVVLPYTGNAAAAGGNLERGIVMAVERVNQAGGIDGKELKPIFADSKSDSERTQVLLEELLRQDVQAVIGPENHDVAAAIMPRLRQRGVLLLSPYLGDSIEYDSASDWPWYRLAPTATVMGEALAKRMDRDGRGNVAFVYSEDRYSRECAEAAMRRYEQLGGSVDWAESIDPDSVSHAAAVRGFPASGTTTVALIAQPLAAAQLVVEVSVGLPDASWDWYLAPQLKTPAFLENTVTSVLEDAIGVAPHADADSSEFAAAYQQRYADAEPLEGVLFYYDAVVLLAFSLQKAWLENDGRRPGYAELSECLRSTASPSGTVTRWSDLDRGLAAIAEGRSAYYFGLTGPILLDRDGARQLGTTGYWTVQSGRILPLP